MTSQGLEMLSSVSLDKVIILGGMIISFAIFMLKAIRVVNSIHDKQQEVETAVEKVNTLEKQVTSLHGGVFVLLQYRFYRECTKLIEKGHCSLDKRTTLKGMYEAYVALGGNGVGTDLYNKVLELPIKPEEGKV